MLVDYLIILGLILFVTLGPMFAWQWYDNKQKKNVTIANPRIHMICGVCGSSKDFAFKIFIKTDLSHEVLITCDNCASLTSLEEVITNGDKCSINKG